MSSGHPDKHFPGFYFRESQEAAVVFDYVKLQRSQSSAVTLLIAGVDLSIRGDVAILRIAWLNPPLLDEGITVFQEGQGGR